ncbi:hypothetical protein [Photobacterium damselae]|uniref:hypothetical protein n=1 Tax=Photobacterium damselae TaxID=38293 RepID=UPI00165DD29A|nr:hypothetical protein [Photobacterium damselae]
MNGFYCSLMSIDLTKINQGWMRLCDAAHDVVFNGHTYMAMGTLLHIDSITTENTISSKELRITLSGISVDFQEAVNTNTFKRAPIVIHKAFVPTGTNIVESASIYYRGYTSTPETDINYEDGHMAIEVTCKSVFDLDQKPSLCRANNATHQAYHNGDKFFEYANQDMGEDVMWRKP